MLWELLPAACRLSPTLGVCRQRPASVTPTSTTPHCIYESFFTPCQQRCIPTCHPMSSPCPLQPPGSRTAHGAGRLPHTAHPLLLPGPPSASSHHRWLKTSASCSLGQGHHPAWGPPMHGHDAGATSEASSSTACMPKEGTKRTARCSLNSRLFAQAAAAL